MENTPSFIHGIVPPDAIAEPAFWFAFQKYNLLVDQGPSSVSIPCLIDFDDLGIPILRQHYLGQLNGRPCYTVEVAEGVAPPEGMAFEGFRSLFDRLDEPLFWLAGRAMQIVDWDRTHQYCGRCGTPMRLRVNERAKECPRCGLLHFPRISPAIIVLVERGDELLLARSHRSAPGIYSVLAGFVEPGETLEAAVEREVKEEVGLRIKDIRYFGSQPWPFPHSLMIAFTATYADGEIVLDESEMEDAQWFTVKNLPRGPMRISIARRLIDWFIEKQQGKLYEG
jgi:NAD+ diphosphatase